jgi:hypothetical protein
VIVVLLGVGVAFEAIPRNRGGLSRASAGSGDRGRGRRAA